IFLFYGIFKMTPKDLSDLYIPWIIIGIAAIIGLVLIEKVKKDNKNEATEVYINYLITFTRPLMLTLPLMSAVFLYLRSEEHTSELQSRFDLVCRLLLEKKKKITLFVQCIH